MDKLEKMNHDLASENASLKASIRSLTNKVEKIELNSDETDQYMRNRNLLLHGLNIVHSAPPDANLQDRVIEIINSNLGTNISATDIDVVHRLNKSTLTGTA